MLRRTGLAPKHSNPAPVVTILLQQEVLQNSPLSWNILPPSVVNNIANLPTLFSPPLPPGRGAYFFGGRGLAGAWVMGDGPRPLSTFNFQLSTLNFQPSTPSLVARLTPAWQAAILC